MATLVRRVDRRLVDGFGMVACAREGRDVTLDHCLACRDLIGAIRAPDGQVEEIRCRAASRRAPEQGTTAWEPLGPLGPFRP